MCSFYLQQEICIINHNQKIQQRRGSHDDSSSLESTLQVRRLLWVTVMCDTALSVSSLKTFSVVQAEDDEAKRNVSMSQERQRTLEKLRSLRQVRTVLRSDL